MLTDLKVNINCLCPKGSIIPILYVQNVAKCFVPYTKEKLPDILSVSKLMKASEDLSAVKISRAVEEFFGYGGNLSLSNAKNRNLLYCAMRYWQAD